MGRETQRPERRWTETQRGFEVSDAIFSVAAARCARAPCTVVALCRCVSARVSDLGLSWYAISSYCSSGFFVAMCAMAWSSAEGFEAAGTSAAEVVAAADAAVADAVLAVLLRRPDAIGDPTMLARSVEREAVGETGRPLLPLPPLLPCPCTLRLIARLLWCDARQREQWAGGAVEARGGRVLSRARDAEDLGMGRARQEAQGALL